MSLKANTAPVAVDSAATETATATRAKSTFMLHDPTDMSCAGRFVAPGYREAALKAASRGHTDILLRKSGTREIRQFKGVIETLDTPKIVKRGDREVAFHKKPNVKFEKKFYYDGKTQPDEEPEVK